MTSTPVRAQAAIRRDSRPSARAMARSSNIRGARRYSAVWPWRMAEWASAQAR